MNNAAGLKKLFVLFLAVDFYAIVSGDFRVPKKMANSLHKVDVLMSEIEREGLKWSHAEKQKKFKEATKLLKELTTWEVWLITQRPRENGDTLGGTEVDDLISQNEEKSYQLKAMLIELNQTGGTTTYVANLLAKPSSWSCLVKKLDPQNNSIVPNY